ncbi:MAG: hypothetical protein ACLFPH_03855 [Bacteroidales bacterium]
MLQTIQGIALLVVFIVITALMSKRIWPAMLALPVLAIFISIISGIHIEDIFKYVIGEGTLKLTEPMVIAMLGGVLSLLMQRTGIAEGFIKKGAELAGDKPLTISILMLVFIILLFTSLGGLGAMIMVGSIVLPILTSVGIGSLTAAVIMLMGVNIGGMFNFGNWSLYMNSLDLTKEEVQRFVSVMVVIVFLGTLVYLGVQLYRDGFDLSKKRMAKNFALVLLIGAGLYLLRQHLADTAFMEYTLVIWDGLKTGLYYLLLAGLILLYAYAAIRAFTHRNKNTNPIHWSAIFTPIIPLFLILVFNLNFVAAFVLGITFGFAITYKRDHVSLLLKSLVEGSSVVLPAVILMFGIGWILVSVRGPETMSEAELMANYGTNIWPVRDLLVPFVQGIIPQNGWQYVLVFTILAPLALYRGPLNVWGMGFGIASVLLAAGMMPGAILGMLWSVGQIQAISDPTNLQNVWVANEMKVEVQKILMNTLPFSWVFAFLGLVAAAIMYF